MTTGSAPVNAHTSSKGERKPAGARYVSSNNPFYESTFINQMFDTKEAFGEQYACSNSFIPSNVLFVQRLLPTNLTPRALDFRKTTAVKRNVY